MATRISKHLLAYGVFSHEQLMAFNASLTAAVSANRDEHTTLPWMQNLDALEHCFLQSDWDQLVELGEQPKQTSDPLEDILAIRMHRLGIVCPDADTLEKSKCYNPGCHARGPHSSCQLRSCNMHMVTLALSRCRTVSSPIGPSSSWRTRDTTNPVWNRHSRQLKSYPTRVLRCRPRPNCLI